VPCSTHETCPAGPCLPRPHTTPCAARITPPKPIPANVTPRFGLLTQKDAQPSADRMPVWAFTSKSCLTSGNPTPAPTCIYWVFARASDGKDLGVWDPQPLSYGRR
jgi:hypothetical protein